MPRVVYFGTMLRPQGSQCRIPGNSTLALISTLRARAYPADQTRPTDRYTQNTLARPSVGPAFDTARGRPTAMSERL